jgi:hypothetical protein
MHWAEYGGIGAAVVSTLAAVVGELLAAGVSWPWWDNAAPAGGEHKPKAN